MAQTAKPTKRAHTSATDATDTDTEAKSHVWKDEDEYDNVTSSAAYCTIHLLVRRLHRREALVAHAPHGHGHEVRPGHPQRQPHQEEDDPDGAADKGAPEGAQGGAHALAALARTLVVVVHAAGAAAATGAAAGAEGVGDTDRREQEEGAACREEGYFFSF